MATVTHFSGNMFQIAHQVRRHYSLGALGRFGRNVAANFLRKSLTHQVQDVVLVCFIFFPLWAIWFVFGPFQS